MQARLVIKDVLNKHGYNQEVPMPDISTKKKAQKYIGLDMKSELAAKDEFLKTPGVPASFYTGRRLKYVVLPGEHGRQRHGKR